MSITTPKPGPHLSTSTTYRQLAKDHAAAADRILAGVGLDYLDSPDVLPLITKAQVHALLSIAYTDMAPPPRFRPNHARRQSPVGSSWTENPPAGA